MPNSPGRFRLFKVASVSENLNSFGLQGMILMARSGETWEVGANHLNAKKKGTQLNVPLDRNGEPDFSKLGFEIQRNLEKAPAKVAKEVWK